MLDYILRLIPAVVGIFYLSNSLRYIAKPSMDETRSLYFAMAWSAVTVLLTCGLVVFLVSGADLYFVFAVAFAMLITFKLALIFRGKPAHNKE